MSEAMLDSGHHWWLRCDDHDIAWFNGGVEEPTEEDWGRNPCPMCIMEASNESRIAALEAEVAQARERALEEAAAACETAAVPLTLDEWQGTRHNLTRATADSLAQHIRALKSKPAQESRREPMLADYCPEARPVEMASEENGLLPPRRCTNKRCVTYEGRTFHALGCKLAESFGSDPDDRDTP